MLNIKWVDDRAGFLGIVQAVTPSYYNWFLADFASGNPTKPEDFPFEEATGAKSNGPLDKGRGSVWSIWPVSWAGAKVSAGALILGMFCLAPVHFAQVTLHR